MEGVAYLHGHTPVVIHGDLKPVRRYNKDAMILLSYEFFQENCLIDDRGNPKICGFGLARIFLEDCGSETNAHTGMARYLAYELAVAEASIPTTASDIYATGCIGLEVQYCDSGNITR